MRCAWRIEWFHTLYFFMWFCSFLVFMI
jgi:hypothetical protein